MTLGEDVLARNALPVKVNSGVRSQKVTGTSVKFSSTLCTVNRLLDLPGEIA